jgi:hypothetical protein
MIPTKALKAREQTRRSPPFRPIREATRVEFPVQEVELRELAKIDAAEFLNLGASSSAREGGTTL